MTDNLGLGRIAAGMDVDALGAKSNDVDGGLDAAITQPLTVEIDDSNTATLTIAQFVGNLTFILVAGSPGPSAGITINVPNEHADTSTLRRGNFNVVNDTGQTATIQVSGQSETAPTVDAGARAGLTMDGDNVYSIAAASGGGGGGGSLSVHDRGTVSSGTETPEYADGEMQKAVNGGAHTLAAMTAIGYYVLTYSNNASAGAITASGWDRVDDADSVLSHTVENSVIECAAYNDGVSKRLIVTLIEDATP